MTASQSQQYYDQDNNTYGMSPVQPYHSFVSQASTAPVAPHYSAQQHWSQTQTEQSAPQLQYSQWPPASSSQTYPATSQSVRSSYPPQHPHSQWPSQSSSYIDADSTSLSSQPFQRAISPSYHYAAGESQPTSSSDAVDVVPPPRAGQRRTSPSIARDQYVGGGRSSGNPPVGVIRCSSCKVTQSPEWRKGPSGKKDLCNACVYPCPYTRRHPPSFT